MKIAARLSRKTVVWLQAHPEDAPMFLVMLGQVLADELQLIARTFPLVDPETGHMVRAFEFGRTGLYLAVIQWKHGEKKVRVVECRDRV